MKSSEVDVHELAAMPGFGKAGEVIREKVAPHWGKAGESGLIKFEVAIEVERTIQDTEYFTIHAKTEQEAIEKAKAELEEEFSLSDYRVESAYVTD